MTEFVIELLGYVIYSIELFLVNEGLFHNREKNWKKYAVAILLYFMFMLPLQKIWLPVTTALNIFISVYLFRGKLKSKIMHFVEIYLFAGIVDVILESIILISLKKYGQYNALLGETGITLLSAFIICMIVRQKWFQTLFSYFQLLKWFQYMVIFCILISSMALLYSTQYILNLIGNISIGIVFYVLNITLFCIIIIGIIWLVCGIYKTDYYTKQNQIKDEIIHAQQKYYQSIYENDKEMRRFRHDIRSQLGAIKMLLEEGKTEQASHYLEEIDNDFNKKIPYKYHTGNEILDAVINYTCSYAEQKNIFIHIKGKIDTLERIDVYDLCTIFSNAINNAIEACERLENERKNIEITILQQNKAYFFFFENPAIPEMYEAIKRNETLKTDNKNHGLGIGNIRKAVKENGGELEYIYKDGKIRLEIFFEG